MTIKSIISRSTPLYASAASTAELETECLFGEQFDVIKTQASFSYGQLMTDGYQGWLPSAALGDLPIATHRVLASSWVRSNKDIKSSSLLSLSIGSLIAVTHQSENISCVSLPDSVQAYMPASHLVDANHQEHDWVAIAEGLIGVPYVWGGRTSSGLDCSALVQLAAQSAQSLLPRNSSQQQLQGSAIDNLDQLQRGDLVFWKGHVGIMQSATQLLHANAHHMQVASEPLKTAADRINNKEGSITALRRLSVY